MKKHIILLSIILTSSFSRAFSQSISNTTWAVYDTTNTFFLYFHFSSDTLSYSGNNISYNNISTYQVSANSFTIIDLPAKPCPSDTGRYTFLIQNNSLQFTLIGDFCQTRGPVLSRYHWVKQITGTKEMNISKSINMYPDPAQESLTIPIDGTKTIVVINLSGQIVKTLRTDGKVITLEDLAPGVYLVRVFNNDNLLLAERKIVHDK